MNLKTRIDIEKRLARRVVADGLEAGFEIAVFDGGEIALTKSVDAKAIIAAMFSTDEDQLYFYKDGKHFGTVYFVYGNDGYDVIADNTVNLEPFLKGATALADELAEKHG